MRSLAAFEIELISGGQTTSPKPKSESISIYGQIMGELRQGNFGTALGIVMDNPYTLAGNAIDQIMKAQFRDSDQRAEMEAAMSKYQMAQ